MTTDGGVCIKYYVQYVSFVYSSDADTGGCPGGSDTPLSDKSYSENYFKNASFWGPQAPRPLAFPVVAPVPHS